VRVRLNKKQAPENLHRKKQVNKKGDGDDVDKKDGSDMD
jgi:hypothetical protein